VNLIWHVEVIPSAAVKKTRHSEGLPSSLKSQICWYLSIFLTFCHGSLFIDCLSAIKVPSTTRQAYDTCISFNVSTSPLYEFLPDSNK